MKPNFISNGLVGAAIVSIFMGTGFLGCSSIYRSEVASLATPTPKPTPVPTPSPPKPIIKNKLIRWRCKILNGEGRVFEAADDVAQVAERKARVQCEVSYRRCTFLDCKTFIVEE